MNTPRYGATRGLMLLAAALLVIGACGRGLKAGRHETAEGESPSRMTIRGDWNDVEAAAIIAASKAEMAVSTLSPEGQDRVVIELVTVRDEPARAIVTRSPSEPGTLTAEARVGRFGDPAAERRFLEALARRLRELRGRETSPVRF